MLLYRILRMLRHDVVSMEDYVASDAYPLDKCLADVAECTVLRGIDRMALWATSQKRTIPKAKSITELELPPSGQR